MRRRGKEERRKERRGLRRIAWGSLLLSLTILASAEGQEKNRAGAQGAARPRIFLRAKAPTGDPSLEEVLAKSKRAPWSSRLDDLKETTHGKALHWLITGEEASARSCLEDLRRLKPDEGYGLYVQGPVFTLPVAYDWLSAWKGFPDEDRRAIEAKIAATADESVKFLSGRDDCVWHTSAPRSFMGVALAAAALDGPKSQEYLAFARDYFERVLHPAMAKLDGGAVAGMSYGNIEGFAPLSYGLWALKSAFGMDVHARVKKEGDWLAARAEYLAQQTLPDLTFQRWGDIVQGSRCSFRDEGRHVVDMLARATGSPAARWLSRRIADGFKGRGGYHDVVLPEFFVFGEDAGEVRPDFPAERLFGRESIGQGFFRTGWTPDDTIVFFKAGDYFDNHGHFDQGSFTIWRRGHLAVDSGVYDSTKSSHHREYATKSVAHNVILFGGDADGGQRTMSSQDSQDWPDYVAKKASRKLETADVLEWKVEKDHAHAAVDLAAAYDGAVVKAYVREFVWLKKSGVLVVLDRVQAANPARWLLHGVSEPQIEKDTFLFQEKDSALWGTTLLPKKADIRKVGPGCRVDGRDVKPEETGEFGVPGAWRIEVDGPASGMVLHVLAALDKGQSPPAAKLLEEGTTVGVQMAGRKVLFPKGGPGKVSVR